MRNSWKYQSDIFKGGIKLMGLGALAIVFTYFRVVTSHWKTHWFETGAYVIGGLGFILGLILVLLDVIPRIRKK